MLKKNLLLIFLLALGLSLTATECTAASAADTDQPSLKETKHLEHSLELFSKKVVSKKMVMNMQYKRYGKQAVMSFDIIRPNEVMLMLYLLEYSHGEWRIAKEYHYTKGMVPVSSSAC